MNKLVIVGLAAVLGSAAAVAQPHPEGAIRGHGELTRAEAVARAEARFARADADRDGYVTPDEVRAAAGARPAGPAPAQRGRLFERLDTNGDGVLSRQEFEARAALREGRGAGLPGRAGRAGFGEGAFAAVDADRDGRVSRAEATRRALQRFDRLDADQDGRVTVEERRQAREARRARRG